MSDSTVVAPLIKVLNEKISPLLREIEKLQLLKITKISVPIPTIVFFGDHSDGKFSLISSLSGIRLPVGEDGNTSKRPLILKITGKPNNTNAETEFFIENERGVMISAKEDSLCAALKTDTDMPLNFLVKKVNHPDVTLIDLPGTRRVSTEFISPKDMVVVNVVSSEDCFAQGLISSNQEIAKRSLVVFTKVDKLIGRNSAENLELKLNTDNVSDRFMCVRNRVDGENIKTAIDEETKLFAEDMVLSCIDKRNVGLKALANKVVKVYLSIISNTLARILQDIDDDIRTCIQKVDKLVKQPSIYRILKLAENNLRNSFLSTELVDLKEPGTFSSIHLYRIVEKFYNDLTKTLRAHIASRDPDGKFLMYELNLLESKTRLGSFFKPLGSMTSSILKKSYDIIAKCIDPLVKEVMDYVDGSVTALLTVEAGSYPQLLMLLSEASNNLTKKLREDFRSYVIQLIESEKDAQFTCNPDFNVTKQRKIQDICNEVIELVKDRKESVLFAMESFTDYELESSMGVDTKIEHLWSYSQESLYKALNLRFKTNSYRNEMLKRFCDMVGIHLHHLIKKFIDETFYIEMLMELEDGLKNLKEEEPISLLRKREKFERRKEIVEKIRAIVQKQVMESFELMVSTL